MWAKTFSGARSRAVFAAVACCALAAGAGICYINRPTLTSRKSRSRAKKAPVVQHHLDADQLLGSLLEDLGALVNFNTASTTKAGKKACFFKDIVRTGFRRCRQQYWAAGTGYGHSGAAGKKWDVEAYLAAQREQDRRKEVLLQEIAYLLRPDERHTFPEHATCGSGNSNSSGSDEDSWSRTSPPSSVSDVASHSDPRNEGSDGFGGDARGSDRGNEKEKATATEDAPASGAGFNAAAVSAATAAGSASTRDLAAEIYDLSGKRRKKLTYSQEIYRVETVKSSLRVLEESCLVPFLQQLLENDSLLDVDRHASLYTSVFKLVRCITAWRSLHPLLCPVKGQPSGKSIYRLLNRLGDRVKVYRSTTAKGPSGRKSAIPQLNVVNASTKEGWRCGGTSGRGTTGTGLGEGSTSSAGEGTKEDDHSALTDLLLSAVREVEDVVDVSFVEELERASITRPAEASSASGTWGKMAALIGVVGGSSKGRGRAGRNRGGGGCSLQEGRGVQGVIEGVEEARLYRESMAPLQYVEREDLEGFHYRSESAKMSNRGNPQRVKRLGQEHADLSQSLPLSLSSSVFIRTHEDQMDWMQVMISGPDDTPYAGGLFAFDIFFPQNYPQCPPKVKLVTTGGGQHRFNPNLYEDGKVCLSLLGTWDGDGGESWNSQTSTLLQVLVSIQSLILVPEPLFNEPGYERHLGTERGKSLSWDYNARQREGTLRLAMLDMIERPPKGFEEVVNRHFYLRRRYVKEAKEKEKKESEWRSPGHLSRLQGLASKLKEKFASIPPPPPL